MTPNWIDWFFKNTRLLESRDNSVVFDNNVIRFTLRQEDDFVANKSRCEFRSKHYDELGTEKTYEVSFRLPDSWEWLDHNIVVTQWHNDGNDAPNTRPPLLINVDGHDLVITQRTEEGWPYGMVELYRQPILRGVYNKLKIHVKWHFNANAFLKIWRDDELIIDQKAKNVVGTGKHVAQFGGGLYIPNDKKDFSPRYIDFNYIKS